MFYFPQAHYTKEDNGEKKFGAYKFYELIYVENEFEEINVRNRFHIKYFMFIF